MIFDQQQQEYLIAKFQDKLDHIVPFSKQEICEAIYTQFQIAFPQYQYSMADFKSQVTNAQKQFVKQIRRTQETTRMETKLKSQEAYNATLGYRSVTKMDFLPEEQHQLLILESMQELDIFIQQYFAKPCFVSSHNILKNMKK